MIPIIPGGIYRHYKNKTYRVIGIARHEATDEELIIYEPLYESGTKLWARKKQSFIEEVTIDGKTVPRFTYLGHSEKST